MGNGSAMANNGFSTNSRFIMTRESCSVLVVCFKVKNLVMTLDIEDAAKEMGRVPDETGHDRIVLDLSQLKQISSGFVSKIIEFKKMLVSRGGELALCGMGPEIAKVFKLLNLQKIFTVTKDEYEAATSLLEG